MSKLVELGLLAQRVWMRSDGQQMHHAVLMILILEAIHQIYILYDRRSTRNNGIRTGPYS